ncbi:hypothetical protein OH687_24140 [Burkholderia anthina]|nr:hypothetical protein OH687_24140 [Burkholderia anthina]
MHVSPPSRSGRAPSVGGPRRRPAPGSRRMRESQAENA